MSQILFGLLNILGILLALVMGAAFLTWIERRLLGFWQDRRGPNRVGPFGTLQVLADRIKILFKQDWVPPFADRGGLCPCPGSLDGCRANGICGDPGNAWIGIIGNLNIGVLFFLAMAALSVYSVVLAGWASNNKYSLLGGMRAAAQMMTYEVFMGLALVGVVMLSGSFNLTDIVHAQRDMWYIVPQFLGFIVFLHRWHCRDAPLALRPAGRRK